MNTDTPSETRDHGSRVAIIGIAGRFPDAPTVSALWRQLCSANECFSSYSVDELVAEGLPRDLVERPDYIRVKGDIEYGDRFDAAFFGISPHDAQLMDPQHRVMLECAWHVSEDAGYDPDNLPRGIGMFAGCALDTYLLRNVLPHFSGVFTAQSLQAAIGNDKDSLTSKVAYHLNLDGPAVTVQTSSSTSLVAICMACQSLITYESEMALAGGVSLGSPLKCGYLAESAGILSHDGHCRSFDADSTGFVPGNGVGLLMLKRLDDAIRDRDHIYAVISGFAVNNDGNKKVSYTAPSVDGHARVIREAQALAGLAPGDITYVETHGTGTRMGDAVELSALNEVFNQDNSTAGTCAIGSIKSNIGHLDTAAGVAGLIKAAFAVYHGTIPPTLHFRTPNPSFDWARSPFFVNTEVLDWQPASGVRRAGVSSLGMGGTNAHVIVEQPPRRESPETPTSGSFIFPCSAKSSLALATNVQSLAFDLSNRPETPTSDVAYTLAVGRARFPCRAAVVASSLKSASERVSSLTASDFTQNEPNSVRIGLIFPAMFAAGFRIPSALYQCASAFREGVDECAEALIRVGIPDIRSFEIASGRDSDGSQICTAMAVSFGFQFAMSRHFRQWGVQPAFAIGHQLGELSAAASLGLVGLDDAARQIVAASGIEAPDWTAAATIGGAYRPGVPLYSTRGGQLLEIVDGHEFLPELNRPDDRDLVQAVTVLNTASDLCFVNLGSDSGSSSALAELASGGALSGQYLVAFDESSEIEDASEKLNECLAAIWTRGCDLDWSAAFSGPANSRVPLPGYSFDKVRHWLEVTSSDSEINQGTLTAGTCQVHKKPRPRLSSDYTEPQNATQQSILEIFEDALGIEGIGINDDLFELGGHSLMVATIATRVREVCGHEVTADDVFSNSTAKELSDLISGKAEDLLLLEQLLNENSGKVR